MFYKLLTALSLKKSLENLSKGPSQFQETATQIEQTRACLMMLNGYTDAQIHRAFEMHEIVRKQTIEYNDLRKKSDALACRFDEQTKKMHLLDFEIAKKIKELNKLKADGEDVQNQDA